MTAVYSKKKRSSLNDSNSDDRTLDHKTDNGILVKREAVSEEATKQKQDSVGVNSQRLLARQLLSLVEHKRGFANDSSDNGLNGDLLELNALEKFGLYIVKLRCEKKLSLDQLAKLANLDTARLLEIQVGLASLQEVIASTGQLAKTLDIKEDNLLEKLIDLIADGETINANHRLVEGPVPNSINN